MSDELPDPNQLTLDTRRPQIAVCFEGFVWHFGAFYQNLPEVASKFERDIVKAMLRSALEAMEEQ